MDATVTIAEDTSKTFGVADFGFADADAGQSLAAVRIDSLPGAGALTLNGVAVAAGQVVAASDIAGLVFAPAANANGNGYASFSFSVQDSAGAFDATPNAITINVTPVADPAQISGTISGATIEDTTLVAAGTLNVCGCGSRACQRSHDLLPGCDCFGGRRGWHGSPQHERPG